MVSDFSQVFPCQQLVISFIKHNLPHTNDLFLASRTLIYWYYLISFLMPTQQWLILSPSHPKFLPIFTIHLCKICSILQPLDLVCSQCITFNVQKNVPEIYYADALKLLVVWSTCRSIRDVKVFSSDFNCIYWLWMIKFKSLLKNKKFFEVAYCIIKWIQLEILLNCFWYTTRDKSKALGWMHITLDQY